MTKGILLGLGATVLWASFYPLGRLLFGVHSDDIEPMNLTFIRLVFSSLFFMPMLLKKRNRQNVRRLLFQHWRMLLLLSGVGIIVEGVLVFWALKYTTSARVSILANASPLSTLLLSWFCGREILNGSKIIGVLVGFVGIVLIFSTQGADVFSGESGLFIGDAMAFLSGICWSVYTVFGEEISQRYGGMICNAVLFSISTIMIIPLVFICGQGFNFNLPWQVWISAFYLGVFTNALANGMWYSALKYVTPGELGACGYISGLLSFLMALSFLNEKVSWQFVAAIACVIAGTILMFQRKSLIKKSDH